MKIGIMSDSHDHMLNIQQALGMMKEMGVTALLHCGDFCAPYVVKALADSGLDIHLVFGNTNDEFSTTKIAASKDNITLYGITGELELGGKKIAFVHYPNIAEGLAATGKYDAVFYGHNHTKAVKKVDCTILANPGEIVGLQGKPSFAVYDTEKDEVILHEFP